MKLKPLNIILLSALLVVVITFLNSCNWGSPNYTLTVIVGDGISGTPTTGTYEYKEFTAVEFEYEIDEGAVQPEIYLNTLRSVALNGSLIMYSDIEMTIKQVDVRDEWVLVLLEDDEEISQWNVEFSGSDLRSGTFTDDRGYSGTWQVTDSDELTITYSDWENYILTGTLSDLGGDWDGKGKSGTWYMYLR